MIGVQPPDFPYGKGGFEVSGGGGGSRGRKTQQHTQLSWGKVSPGVISQMNPGSYRPLYVGGPLVGGVQPNELPSGSAKGASSSRPMVARLVRYGPVRQKKTFLQFSTLRVGGACVCLI